jgi:hypothetical protein
MGCRGQATDVTDQLQQKETPKAVVHRGGQAEKAKAGRSYLAPAIKRRVSTTNGHELIDQISVDSCLTRRKTYEGSQLLFHAELLESRVVSPLK